jgi:hypothetical protein
MSLYNHLSLMFFKKSSIYRLDYKQRLSGLQCVLELI